MNLLSARLRFFIKKMKKGILLEPMELAYIDVPDEFTGTVIDKLSQRKGELQNMGTSNGGLYPSGIS